VHPILLSERVRFDKSLDERHWLGHHLVGETMRYVPPSAEARYTTPPKVVLDQGK